MHNCCELSVLALSPAILTACCKWQITHLASWKRLFVECSKAWKSFPFSSSQTQRTPPYQIICSFPPFTDLQVLGYVYNMLWNVELINLIHCSNWTRAERAEICCPSEHRVCFSSSKVRLFDSHCHREVKWRSKKIRGIKQNSAVRSVWIYWRSRWLFPVDTTTAWTVLKPTGMKRMTMRSTAALSVGRPSHRGRLWWKTPC